MLERDEGHAVSGVGSGRDLQRGYGARLGDALLEHLPVPGFAVAQDQVRVDRLVALAPGA